MGMFGSLGKALLNQAGINLLGVDFEGQARRKAQLEAVRQAQLRAAGLLAPAPGQVRQSAIGNDAGEDISAAFAPQMEQGPSRNRTPQEVAQGLAALTASTPGFNPKPFSDLAAYAKPSIRYDRGQGYDDATGARAGEYHPDLEKGEEPLYDANGRLAGVRNIAGSVQSLADREAAKAGAQAAYQPVQTQGPDGAPMTITAADLAKRGGMVGLTPGQKVQQEGTAKTEVDRAAAQPQQFSGLQDQARTTKLVVSTIDRLLPKIGGWTAGVGANLGGIKGTPAHDLQADLDTIRANVGFDALAKMRANSPTGGALGAVSEKENALLQSVLGSLDAGQSPAQLAASLKRVRNQLAEVSSQRADLYKNTYNGPQAPAAPRTTMGRSRIISVQ